MNPQFFELYQRIQAFDLDADGASFPFSQKLARENRWSQAYTRRVVEEYKKFAFLAMVAGHPVTPSEQVDHAWHLHLIYTRSYWEEFCQKVLGRPLHHDPTQGGPVEQGKFHDWYGKTLASYARLFGEAPPADIWPDAAIRFGRDLHHVRVNTRQYWLLAKPRWPRLSRRAWLLPLVSLLVASCAGEVNIANPLAWDAGGFLMFYVLAGILVLHAANTLRDAMRLPNRGSRPLDVKLPMEELAYLAGGAGQAVDTLLFSLIQRGCLELDETRKTLRPSAPGLPPDLDVLEEAVFNLVAPPGATLATVRSLAESGIHGMLKANLQQRGLWVTPKQSATAQNYASAVFLPLLVLGVIRLHHGLEIDKPVGFLLGLLTFCVWLYCTFTALGRSRYGDSVLEHAQRQDMDKATDDGLLRAVALFGLSALNGTALADVGAVLSAPPQHTRSGSSDGGGGGCGGGCGGG